MGIQRIFWEITHGSSTGMGSLRSCGSTAVPVPDVDGMDAGASSCCSAGECSLQLFLLTSRGKPSPQALDGSIIPASNSHSWEPPDQGGSGEISRVDVLFNDEDLFV